MKDEMFDELLASVEQADEIVKGNSTPARVTEFAEPDIKKKSKKAKIKPVPNKPSS